ncbi:hypothetical protein [Streptomyces stelliscabiei]|uniref:hypothetical protein n=1 Tax=Streptomyces stelliscabiei TaxID=146820 RepID=UPI0029B80F2C|nr:hypothetical protein [Streptomyces stelliscabiei]MDX2550138.1 hypothetical protein [Streptomyces stelliscabiei]
MPVPAFTPRPGGFVTATPLPDGRTLIEGWILNLNPYDSDQPRTDPACHWIAANDSEAAATIAEFTNDLNAPITA